VQCQSKPTGEEFKFKKTTFLEKKKVSQQVTLSNKGIGPIQEVTMSSEPDTAMVKRGGIIYHSKCAACHRVDKKFIGPPPTGILKRRSPEWIMNLILNTDEMLQKDSTTNALFMEFNGQLMTNQNLTVDEARDVVEYFRTLD